jgi:hypothetical protein
MENKMAVILTLAGKSQKGKNRIREHGSKWKVLPAKVRPLPRNKYFIMSTQTGERRWIDKQHDKDFTIISVEA